MTETFQISLPQAEAYEQHFVPALFGQWVPTLLDLAELRRGQRVLDVACGTGVVARQAAELVGDPSLVTGLDLNPAMLEVAARVQPDIDWRTGDAAALPFGAGEYDAVVCQSALMFLTDRAGAVAEMARVVAPGGSVTLQSYAPVADQPGYGPFVETVVRHAGEETRAPLDLYWSAGDPDDLTAWCRTAGLTGIRTQARLGTARFPSVRALAETEIRGTPLSDRVTDETFERIVAECGDVLAGHVTAAGSLDLPIRAVFVTGRRPATGTAP